IIAAVVVARDRRDLVQPAQGYHRPGLGPALGASRAQRSHNRHHETTPQQPPEQAWHLAELAGALSGHFLDSCFHFSPCIDWFGLFTTPRRLSLSRSGVLIDKPVSAIDSVNHPARSEEHTSELQSRVD